MQLQILGDFVQIRRGDDGESRSCLSFGWRGDVGLACWDWGVLLCFALHGAFFRLHIKGFLSDVRVCVSIYIHLYPF